MRCSRRSATELNSAELINGVGVLVLVGRPGQGQRQWVVQGARGDAVGMFSEVVADPRPPTVLGVGLVAQ